MKKLVIFDLDGTLAESKSAIDDEMSARLTQLLEVAQVAVISGGDWPQFETQVISHLPQDQQLRRLSMLPTCGTKFFSYDGTWLSRYSEDLTADEKALIAKSLADAVVQGGFQETQIWGEQIEDRGSQITYSALGQSAPLSAKRDWDPDFAKRTQILSILEGPLAQFSVRMGGTTSIDVTKPGIDKGYGIAKLREILGIEIPEMLFVGDALFPGGNDYPAKEAGVTSIQVNGPADTKLVIETFVACMRDA